jgi:PA domain-containing protein
MCAQIRGAWRHTIAASALLLGFAGAASAATITVLNLDGPGEGFNDPTPAAPVGGNPETTIGAQRLFVFRHAADIWSRILPSTVEIRINAHFDPLDCDASSAVLGQTSAGSSHRNFANAPFTNTWYQQALANRLAGFDLNPAVNDMNITYNSNLCQPGCAFCWYYGVDGNEGTKIELLPVVLHEIGHGLGFATITVAGVQSGTPPGPHVYDRFLYDLDQDMHWNEMPGDAQRGASAVNCQRLVWDGTCVAGSVASYLGPKPVLRVNTPAAIAGDYEVGLATFGPQTFNVTGNLVLVNDGSLPPLNSPTNGCEPFVNAAQVAGNIALVDRGTCPFTVKVKNAQNAGAVAVVVVDTMPGCPPLGMSGVDPTITIPVVRVTTDDGATIKSQLAGGVNVNMLFDAVLMAGTKEGKIMVYTPTVLATGSSVSHWDISATPNLLMEPFSTASISSSVDLTLNLFEDIGWLGATSVCASTAGVGPDSPATAAVLGRPYPNPTSRGAAINFRILRPEYVHLTVVDVSGRKIRSLHEGMLPPGAHMRHWDGMTDSGREAPAGVYLLSLRTSEGLRTQRIALSR